MQLKVIQEGFESDNKKFKNCAVEFFLDAKEGNIQW